MKICINCFVDVEIRSIIQSLEYKGDCGICEALDNYVYDTNQHTVLERTFSNLLERYTTKANLNESFPRKLTVSIKSELKNNWNIFNKLEESQIYDVLIEICSEKYEEAPEFFDDLVGVAELGSNEYINKNTLFYAGSWDDFSKELKYKTRFHSKKFNTDIFSKYLSFLTVSINKDTVLYRGRMSEKKGFPINKMGSVSPEKSLSGRANPRGIPYRYLSEGVKTVPYELRATKMNYVTIAEFVLKESAEIIDLTKIEKMSPFVFEDEEMLTLHIVNRKHLERTHDEMVKPVTQYESYLDYLPTQYIFDFIRNNKNVLLGRLPSKGENNHREIIGVKYQSSLHSNGINYVFFEESYFEKRNAAVYKIDNVEYQMIEVD